MKEKNHLILFALIGCAIQYWWLLSIPAMSRHAGTVAIATLIATLVTAYLLFRTDRAAERAIDLLMKSLVCLSSGALASLAAYCISESLDQPTAIANSFSQHPALFVGSTILISGGWVVGLLCSAAFVGRMKSKSR